MSTPHTPGPWHVEKALGRYEIWPANKNETHAYIGVAQRETDARLIAAAPELLEACNLLYARLSAHTAQIESCDLDPRTEQAFKAARLAIAKAGGAL